MCISSTGWLMKYTGPTSVRQVTRDPRQAVLQELDYEPVHFLGRLFLDGMTGAWHAQEGRARNPAGEGTPQGDRYQTIGFSPQHQRRHGDAVQSAREAIESELA